VTRVGDMMVEVGRVRNALEGLRAEYAESVP